MGADTLICTATCLRIKIINYPCNIIANVSFYHFKTINNNNNNNLSLHILTKN